MDAGALRPARIPIRPRAVAATDRGPAGGGTAAGAQTDPRYAKP